LVFEAVFDAELTTINIPGIRQRTVQGA
jgi:hypothetical protein